MVLLTDVYRNLTSIWIKPREHAFKQFKSPVLNVITRGNCMFQEEFYWKKIFGQEKALAPVLQCQIPGSDGTMTNGFHVSHLCNSALWHTECSQLQNVIPKTEIYQPGFLQSGNIQKSSGFQKCITVHDISHSVNKMYPLFKTTYFSEGSGCCIEDKCFPKTNSLLDGRQQPLADIEEFSLKIKVSEILCQLCEA